ncbi:bifunctional folylpolyglutamate synthase/dihydrofolate synthase [Nordella sp. HKS 07]|uniref:bifunctional folylpolyglutamate synthase/dihydrofolate synthase n=1 Tax=Nordella sp. HKS 07 TaxID=2712222 RepID=UPI0013E1B561|nr:folylpolyglutamate synthase/dihydrofolate synthase family protein [Nordella sp. HKS 07]QIG48694.1 bifunctional folylpolyglutamate synthase/dihydrofolate synthase [Nordella sp. HKS 07]
MAVSDAILKRLLSLHPKIIDLSLERMWRILARLGDPQEKLPPVLHVAGTNGKGSTVTYLRSAMEAAGLAVHCYTSPHLVKFHERIRLGKTGGGDLISESALNTLLEECEAANGGEPITFFEITTAAAFLAFARHPADYLVLEVGLGGRLDATNVIAKPAISIITTIDYDHQQFLGNTLTEIAREKAGILKRDVAAVIAPQPDEARDEIEYCAAQVGAPLLIANQDWQVYEQHGRLVYQDESGLLDLPLPQLPGRHQIDNAGTAIAALRSLDDARIGESHIAQGLKTASWPARMQRLGPGELWSLIPKESELWLDGGHNPSAGRALARAFSELNERVSRPLVLIWGMLNTKATDDFIAPFSGITHRVVTLTIPEEENAVPARDLAETARRQGLSAETADSLEDALKQAAHITPAPRILILGSLYLAGRVLAGHSGEPMSQVSGAGRR